MKQKLLILNREAKAIKVFVADTFWSRAIGLLSKSSLADDEALLIRPCASVHTIGMRFPIDVVFLDKEKLVLGILVDLKPFRFGFAPKGTASVLELSAGNANRTGIRLEDRLSFG